VVNVDFKGDAVVEDGEIFSVWEEILSGCDTGTDLRGMS
jgi:hypothetical protein